MVKARQNLPLIPEAAGGKFGAQFRAHDLKSDLLLVLTVGTYGAIHCAHPPDTNLLENLVDTDALSGFYFQSGFEDRPDSTPFLGRHVPSSARVISRNNQALAEDQLRFTVAVEIPRNCEVSSSESPPKYRNSKIWLWRASSLARRSSASFSESISTSPCRGCCEA